MKQFKQFIKEDMLQDFEIRFGKESDWKKAGKIVTNYLKKDAPKHAKALLTKTHIIGPDPMMVAVGDTHRKLKPPVNLNKLYDTLRKLPSSRDKYWIKIPKNQEKDALGEGTWATPDSLKKRQALKQLLKKPIKGKDAVDVLQDIIGDDSLWDDLDSAPKNSDVRPIILKYLKSYGPTNKKSWADIAGIK